MASSCYGEVLEPRQGGSEVFVNGTPIAVDEGLRFSYSITKIDSNLGKNLNRERNAVGRSAYSSAIKAILKSVKSSESVWGELARQLQLPVDKRGDELRWNEIESTTAQGLAEVPGIKPVYMTPEERNALSANDIEQIEEQGRAIIFVSGKAIGKAKGRLDTMEEVKGEYNESFTLGIVDVAKLEAHELESLRSGRIMKELLEGRGMPPFPPVYIAERLRATRYDFTGTKGYWDPEQKRILIKRDQLATRSDFLGVLLHEYCHCISGAADNTRDFENELTSMCGLLADALVAGQDAERLMSAGISATSQGLGPMPDQIGLQKLVGRFSLGRFKR